MKPVLSLEGIGKSYRVYRSEWHRLAYWFGMGPGPVAETRILENITLHVHPGEAVAVIGENGAGKSTLLRIVCGITSPTKGSVHCEGNVAAVLELGLGFNQELTGRENAVHALAAMANPMIDLDRAIDEIHHFSELDGYFDEPVRTYSTGMAARLAFSVATAHRPEILIVDEALSVGDAYFQHKSFDRICEFVEQGTTLLFVSHAMSDIRKLCSRVVLLDQGTMVMDGAPEEVIDYYNALIAAKESSTIRQRRDPSGWVVTESGSREAILSDALELQDSATGQPVEVCQVGQKLTLIARVRVESAIPRLVFGVMLKDRVGHTVWGSNTWYTHQVLNDLGRGTRVVFRLNFTCSLGPGSYSVSPALVSSESHLSENFQWIDNALVFQVVNSNQDFFIGSNWMDAVFETEVSPNAA